MERSRFWFWARWVAIGLATLVVVVAVAVVWRTTNIIESELLSFDALADEVVVEVAAVSGSRVTLAPGDRAAVAGVWGVVGPAGYGQVTPVISRDGRGVERGFAVLSGAIAAGQEVRFDANAFPSDPRTAHGIPFEEVRVPGELGVNPAWLIAGASDTWIIFVHGKEPGGRAQSLRAVPTFRRLGLPVLVITYRNDALAPAGDDRHAAWGLDEWRDVEAALETAALRGASDFVLVGYDMGASIVATFLHESERAADVRGVVLDSVVPDLEALVDDITRDRGIPGYLASIGKAISRIRFGLEWSRLDQLDRADEFDPAIPVLLMHGTADEVVPIESADAFAGALANVTYERFSGAGHGALWNSEPVHYEETLTDFLVEVVPDLLVADR